MAQALKILFAVDFKPGCEHAARDLVDLARELPLEITLMHVFDESYFEEKSKLYPEAAQRLNAIQEEVQGRLESKLKQWGYQQFGEMNVKREVEFGHPGDVFSLKSKDYDWLVLGINKHNFFERIFSTSTIESVLGRSFCPAIVLKKKFTGNNEAVVLLDLGDHPRELIENSIAWAKEMRISRLNYYVYYPMPLEVSSIAAQTSVMTFAGDFEDLLGDIMEATKKMIAKYSDGVETSVRVRKISAASSASDIAHDMSESELPVVVGRRKRTRLSEFFLGSVTTALLRSCPADLVILPIED